MARTDLTDRERRISLTEEFIHRLEGIKENLREGDNIIIISERVDIFIEHYEKYIEHQLNSEKTK